MKEFFGTLWGVIVFSLAFVLLCGPAIFLLWLLLMILDLEFLIGYSLAAFTLAVLVRNLYHAFVLDRKEGKGNQIL